MTLFLLAHLVVCIYKMDAVEILEHFFFVIVVVWFVIYFFGNAKLHFFFEKPKQNYRKKGKKVTKRKKVLCRNYKIKKTKNDNSHLQARIVVTISIFALS